MGPRDGLGSLPSCRPAGKREATVGPPMRSFLNDQGIDVGDAAMGDPFHRVTG